MWKKNSQKLLGINNWRYDDILTLTIGMCNKIDLSAQHNIVNSAFRRYLLWFYSELITKCSDNDFTL